MKENFNWFKKTYDSLIEKGKQRGLIKSKLDTSIFYEKHHILPKCMGGLDEDSNYGKDMTGRNNPASKKVMDPFGNIFDSITLCAEAYGVTKSTMSERIKNPKKKI